MPMPPPLTFRKELNAVRTEDDIREQVLVVTPAERKACERRQIKYGDDQDPPQGSAARTRAPLAIRRRNLRTPYGRFMATSRIEGAII
jgi:hypothetical protein